MTTFNWVPNHFVAVLPIGEKNPNDVEFQQRKPVEMKNVQKCSQKLKMIYSKILVQINYKQRNQKYRLKKGHKK